MAAPVITILVRIVEWRRSRKLVFLDRAADRLWRLVLCGPQPGADPGLDHWHHRAGLLGERGWQPPGQAAGVAAPGGHRGGGARGPDAVLTRLPLAAALVVSLAAGLLSPLQPRYALVTALIAPLVLLLLVRLPTWPERDPPAPPVQITSWAWVVAGMVVGLGFVLVWRGGHRASRLRWWLVTTMNSCESRGSGDEPPLRSAVDRGHVRFVVALAGGQGEIVQPCDLLRAQLDSVGCRVLLDAGNAFGAGDRGDVVALRGEPGQGDLCGCGVDLGSDGLALVDDAEVRPYARGSQGEGETSCSCGPTR
jgi:hypothetical protein